MFVMDKNLICIPSLDLYLAIHCCSVAQLCPTLCDPMDLTYRQYLNNTE